MSLPSILFWNINKIINLNSDYSSAFLDKKPATGLSVGNRVRAQSRGARSCHHDNVSTINIARPMCRDAEKQSFILKRTAKRACSALRGCCGALVPLEEGDASPSFTNDQRRPIDPHSMSFCTRDSCHDEGSTRFSSLSVTVGLFKGRAR